MTGGNRSTNLLPPKMIHDDRFRGGRGRCRFLPHRVLLHPDLCCTVVTLMYSLSLFFTIHHRKFF